VLPGAKGGGGVVGGGGNGGGGGGGVPDPDPAPLTRMGHPPGGGRGTGGGPGGGGGAPAAANGPVVGIGGESVGSHFAAPMWGAIMAPVGIGTANGARGGGIDSSLDLLADAVGLG
jgi:translation initiation factor IF-2